LKRAHNRPSPVQSLVSNILIALLSVTLTFGALEIYARYRYFGGSITEKKFRSRGGAFTARKKTPVRIVCVGASTTHGGGDLDSQQTYPFFLEKIMNERLKGKDVEVINSGIPATATEYHRDFIKQRIGDQELDCIVLHSLYNHFSPFYPEYYNPEVQSFIVERGKVRTIYYWEKMSLFEKINIFLMEHSYFYTRLREKIVRLGKQDISDYYKKKSELTGGIPENTIYRADSLGARESVVAGFVSRYYRAIEDCIVTARSRSVDIVLIIPPYPFFPEEFTAGLDEFRDKQYYSVVFGKAKRCLIALGKKYGVLVIDADSEFIKRGRRKEYFLDSVHLSEQGNCLLADIVASELMPHLKDRSIVR